MLHTETWPDHWPPAAARPAISISSFSLFDQCPYAWCQHYMSAELFDLRAQRDIRIAKALTSLAMVTGKVIQAAIESAINDRREGMAWPGDLQERGARLLCEALEGSRRWVERFRETGSMPGRSFRHPPLDIDLYGEGINEADCGRAEIRVRGCLKAFYDGGARDFLDGYDPRHLRMLASDSIVMPWYWLGDAPVYAAIDLLVANRDTFIVIDWKTGDATFDDGRADAQLRLYTGFGRHRCGRSFDDIRVAPVWLSETGAVHLQTVAEDGFAEDALELQHRRTAIRGLMDRALRHPGGPHEVFTPVSSGQGCSTCRFRSCPHQMTVASTAPASDPFAADSWSEGPTT